MPLKPFVMQDTEGTLGGAPQGPARKLLGGGGGGCEGNYGSKVLTVAQRCR